MNIPDLAIREIRARPVVAPLPGPIRTASGDVLDAPLPLIVADCRDLVEQHGLDVEATRQAIKAMLDEQPVPLREAIYGRVLINA